MGLSTSVIPFKAAEAREFTQSKSLKLAGLASDLADWASLVCAKPS